MSTLIPCKNLDHTEGKYDDCTLETCTPHFPEVKFWRRGPRWTDNGPGREPNQSQVQFCKLRGRINDIFDCYQKSEMPCHEQ